MFELAVKIAKDSACDDQHGAVVALGARVMTVATNTLGASSLSGTWYKVTGHAEQNAIIRAGVYGHNGTVYSARIAPQQGTNISKPCEMCEWIMLRHYITRCVYSDGWSLQELVVR